MMDMEYNRTSPFISNCLHYSSEFHPYVGEFLYFCNVERSNAFGRHTESVFALSLIENLTVFTSKRMDEQHSFLV